MKVKIYCWKKQKHIMSAMKDNRKYILNCQNRSYQTEFSKNRNLTKHRWMHLGCYKNNQTQQNVIKHWKMKKKIVNINK